MREHTFDTIIFDLDGTLVDTAPDVHTCCNLALAEMELPTISLEQARRSIGPGPDNFARVTLGEQNVRRFEEFIDTFRRHYKQRCLDNTKPFPGIETLLRQLDDRPLLVATNKPTAYTNHILKGLGLIERFLSVIGPEDVAHLKPYPDMIQLGVKRAKGKVDSTLVVGDTDNDIKAAKGAGVKVCAVAWGYGPTDVLEREKPDFMIGQPHELLDVVNGGV